MTCSRAARCCPLHLGCWGRSGAHTGTGGPTGTLAATVVKFCSLQMSEGRGRGSSVEAGVCRERALGWGAVRVPGSAPEGGDSAGPVTLRRPPWPLHRPKHVDDGVNAEPGSCAEDSPFLLFSCHRQARAPVGTAVTKGRLITVADGQPRAQDGVDSRRDHPHGWLGRLRPPSLTVSDATGWCRAPEEHRAPCRGGRPRRGWCPLLPGRLHGAQAPGHCSRSHRDALVPDWDRSDHSLGVQRSGLGRVPKVFIPQSAS